VGNDKQVLVALQAPVHTMISCQVVSTSLEKG